MNNGKLRLKISFAFLICIMVLIYAAYGAEIQHDDITFTRQGVVIEARNDLDDAHSGASPI